MKYPFEQLFLVCTGARCNDERRGTDRGEVLRDALKDHNRSMGRKPTVRICSVSCLDLCDYGPNIVVHPSGKVYSHLNAETARAVYDGILGDGPEPEAYELQPEELHHHD